MKIKPFVTEELEQALARALDKDPNYTVFQNDTVALIKEELRYAKKDGVRANLEPITEKVIAALKDARADFEGGGEDVLEKLFSRILNRLEREIVDHLDESLGIQEATEWLRSCFVKAGYEE